MSERHCPECQSPMESAALDGLCPRCLAGLLFDPGPPPEAGLEVTVGVLTVAPMSTRGVLLEVPGYEVTKELARGGMGIVYRATQLEPRREVALKMLLPHQLEAEEFHERFLLEARAIARLEHPHILPVYQVGEHDGIPFFTMKLAAGGSLAERRSRYRRCWRDTVQLVATLADAVQYAHQRGVLHRDLKPGNVLFDDAGRPYVSDFGLAKFNDASMPEEEPGQVVGTPRYVAPEVAGQGAEGATVAADIYGLGVILYELLAQKPPFNALSQVALLRMVEHAPPPPPSHELRGVPYELDVVAMRCLEKDPARRFPTAGALAQELRRWLAGEPIESIPATRREQFWRWVRQQRAVVSLTAAIAVLGLILIIGSIWVAFRLATSKQVLMEERNQARNDLVQARLGEARGLRLSGSIRIRDRALDLLAGAARVDPRTELRDEAAAKLRDEAAAILSRWDVGTTGEARHRHTGPGMPLDLSPNFDLVLDAAATGEVRLWRRATGYVVWRMTPKADRVPARLELSPTGKWTVVVPDESRILVLDSATGRELWQGPGQWVGFTAEDQEFAVVNPDGRLEFHDLARSTTRTLELPDERLRGLQLTSSPGRSDLVAQAADHIEVLDGNDGHRRHWLPFDRGEVRSVAWRDNILVVGDSTGGIRMWNLRSGQLRDFNGHRGAVTRLAMSPDAALVWSVSNDGVARLWHARSGQLLGVSELWRPLRFNGDGTRIAYLDGADFGIASILPPVASVLVPLRGEGNTAVRLVEFSPDSRWVVAVQGSGIHLLDPMGNVQASVSLPGVISAHFDSRSRRLLVVQRQGVRWFEINENARRIRLEAGPRVDAGAGDWLGPVARLDGAGQLVVARGGGRIESLDTEKFSWTPLAENLSNLTALDVDPDRTWMALEVNGVASRVLPWRAGKPVWSDSSGTGSPRFSPDGRHLLIVGGESHRVLSVAEWRTRLDLETGGGNTTPGAGAWSTYGRAFAVASPRSGVVVVSTETWLPIVRLQSLLPITCLGFGPHGRMLAAGTDDDHLVIWSLPELREALQARGSLDWHENISPEGRAIAAPTAGPQLVADAPRADRALTSEILPKDPKAPMNVIDLGPVLNRSLELRDAFFNGPREVPADMPMGSIQLGGIPFEVRGVVQLAASGESLLNPRWPVQVKIPISRRPVRKIHVLATSRGGEDLPSGAKLFEVRCQWDGGRNTALPVRLGAELGDGWHQPEHPRAEDHSRALWEGISEASEAARSVVRWYVITVDAPAPGSVLEQLELVSARSAAVPLILSVTVD